MTTTSFHQTYMHVSCIQSFDRLKHEMRNLIVSMFTVQRWCFCHVETHDTYISILANNEDFTVLIFPLGLKLKQRQREPEEDNFTSQKCQG